MLNNPPAEFSARAMRAMSASKSARRRSMAAARTRSGSWWLSAVSGNTSCTGGCRGVAGVGGRGVGAGAASVDASALWGLLGAAAAATAAAAAAAAAAARA